MGRQRSDAKVDFATARELLAFVWRGKSWWLTPIIVVVMLLSALVVFLESSAVAPLIYTLF
jgi:hypothetical protein